MLAILQPLIPHYREEFFVELSRHEPVDLYVTNHKVENANDFFLESSLPIKKIYSKKIGRILFYNPLPLLSSKYDTIVLMGSVSNIMTWVVLFFNLFRKTTTILWGHGISISQYDLEIKKQPLIRKIFYSLCDFAWFYTESEQKSWQQQLPSLKSVSLNNTISGVDDILALKLKDEYGKESLRQKYKINTKINFIFCARFSSKRRRVDLILEFLDKVDSDEFGLIVIGDGKYKPDFSGYENVYDFGSLYDIEKKRDLFSIADLYFQPAHLGLPAVEALAYGLPVCTLERSREIVQGVEFTLVKVCKQSIIANSVDELIEKITKEVRNLQIHRLLVKKFAKDNISMKVMVSRALSSLKK